MNKAVTWGQFIGGLIAIAVTLGTMIYNRATMDTSINMRLTQHQIQIDELKNQNQRLSEKLDDVRDGISEIKVMLQNKQDRQ